MQFKMIGQVSRWLVVTIAGLSLCGSWLLAGDTDAAPEVAQADSPTELELGDAAPTLAAAAYAIFDVETGKVLAGQAVDVSRPVASITKLPAAAAVRTFAIEDTPLKLTAADIETFGAAGKLTAGATFTPRELLYPLLLTSSNDAAAALERVSGNTLLSAMTDLARVAGAYNTEFADASGLSSENRSTAADLAHLTSYLYHVDPTLFSLTTLTQYLGNSQGWQNNNPVRTQAGYRGGKHGYTDEAGRTIVALFDEVIADQTKTLGYVVLGSADVAADVATLRSFVTKTASFE